MEISVSQVKEILDTLPVGYYAGNRIGVTLSEDSPVSFYKMFEDEIVISYQNVAQTLNSMNDDSYTETAIRSLLYHEVGHALMTPKSMQPTDILNIFEDERLETILKYYFRNVNFKENVIRLNGFTGEAPQSAMEEFYQTVRYRKGESAYLYEVNRIIDKYETMTATKYDTYWGWNYDSNDNDNVGSYISDVYDLYNRIAAKWGEPPRNKYDDQRNGNQSQGFLEGDKGKASAGKQLSAEDMEKMAAELEAASKEQDKSHAGTKVDSPDTLNGNISYGFYDQNLTTNLERIIDNFNKKNNGGSSVNAYSGIFNPRNVVRKDYKYFDHKMAVNGNNIFGTFHLNLWIDDSGSMSGNTRLINQLMYSLMEIEKKNRNFTFSAYTCADRIEKMDKKKGYQARGGTHLRKSIVPLFKGAQEPGTFNYNIVIYDGSCSTDPYLNGNTFLVFNTANTTIITDESNRRSLAKNENCKIIYCDNYVEEFFDNVFKVLQGAFR